MCEGQLELCAESVQRACEECAKSVQSACRERAESVQRASREHAESVRRACRSWVYRTHGGVLDPCTVMLSSLISELCAESDVSTSTLSQLASACVDSLDGMLGRPNPVCEIWCSGQQLYVVIPFHTLVRLKIGSKVMRIVPSLRISYMYVLTSSEDVKVWLVLRLY